MRSDRHQRRLEAAPTGRAPGSRKLRGETVRVTPWRWLCLLALLATGACAPPPSELLPAATVLVFDPPAGWRECAPLGRPHPALPIETPASYCRTVEPSGVARLTLHTLAVPEGLSYPVREADQIAFMSGLIEPTTFQRWLEVRPGTYCEAPGVYAVAGTTEGLTHMWAVFAKRKLFVLELRYPTMEIAESRRVGSSVLAAAQLK